MMSKPIKYLVFLAIVGLSSAVPALAQMTKQKADSLITVYNSNIHDTLKINYALLIGGFYAYLEPTLTLKYCTDALERADAFLKICPPDKKNRWTHKKYSLSLKISIAYEHLGVTDKAIDYRMKCVILANEMKDVDAQALSMMNLGEVLVGQGEYQEAMKYYRKCLALKQSTTDHYILGLILGNMGDCYGSVNNDSVMYYYRLSLGHLLLQTDTGAIAWMLAGIGDVFRDRNEYDSALHYYFRSLELRTAVNHYLGQYLVLCDIATMYKKAGKTRQALEYVNKSLDIAKKQNFKKSLDEAYFLRSELYEQMGKVANALDDYKMAVALKDTAVNEKNTSSLLKQSMKYEFEKKETVDRLKIEKQDIFISRQRIALVSATTSILLIVVLAVSIFRGKKRSDDLLLNILPADVATELKKNGKTTAKHYDKVTVLFTDFVNFTQASERMDAHHLIDELHACFKAFDDITTLHKVEKIKTIGDAYLAVCGLPVANPNHAENIVRAAIDINQFMANRLAKMGSERTFAIRIGIHSGSVVAGIVGVKKFAYDIWGDTVNTAARMEQHGVAGKINISQTTYELVKDKFNCEYRGEVEAKGKGVMKMYFIS